MQNELMEYINSDNVEMLIEKIRPFLIKKMNGWDDKSTILSFFKENGESKVNVIYVKNNHDIRIISSHSAKEIAIDVIYNSLGFLEKMIYRFNEKVVKRYIDYILSHIDTHSDKDFVYVLKKDKREKQFVIHVFDKEWNYKKESYVEAELISSLINYLKEGELE
jgi:hypothetical protein